MKRHASLGDSELNVALSETITYLFHRPGFGLMVARSAFRVQCLNEKAATGSLKAILLVSITSLNSFFHSFCYILQFATDPFFL